MNAGHRIERHPTRDEFNVYVAKPGGGERLAAIFFDADDAIRFCAADRGALIVGFMMLHRDAVRHGTATAEDRRRLRRCIKRHAAIAWANMDRAGEQVKAELDAIVPVRQDLDV